MRSEYLNGCMRYAVQGKVDKDGKVPDSVYFDELQLEVIGDTEMAKAEPNRSTGGPAMTTPRETCR